MFITFEGGEGSGKSHQIQLLSEYLKEQGFYVVLTREPGGTKIGDAIRDVLHDTDNIDMCDSAEMLLYAASRAQLIEEVIRPALNNQKIVLSDRFEDSTIAYQGYGRGLNIDMLTSINRTATSGLNPDCTIYLDLDIRTGLKRKERGHSEINRLDLESLEFHDRVRAGYLQMERENWHTIDASQTTGMVNEEIIKIIKEYL